MQQRPALIRLMIWWWKRVNIQAGMRSRNCFTVTREIGELRVNAGGENHAATLRQLWKLLHAQAKAYQSRNTAGNATWLMF